MTTNFKNIILISNDNKNFTFNREIICKLSKVVKKIINSDEEEIDNKIPIMFGHKTIKILCNFINYININDFNFIFKISTLDYIFKDFVNLESNKNNILIWDFIDKLSIEDTSNFFELARYLNIELLEELLCYNIMLKMKKKEKNLIEKLKDKINYIKNKIKLKEKNLKKYLKINNFNKINWLNFEEYSSDNSNDYLSDYEEEEYLYNDIDSQLHKSNNDKKIINNEIEKIKNDLSQSIKKYIQIHKSDIIFLDEKKKYYINKIKFLENNISKKVLDWSNHSQNLFFVNNTCLCKTCHKIWFLSSLYNDLETIYEKYKKCCQVCVDEILCYYEEFKWDIKSVLINKGFEYTNDDKHLYIDENHTTEDFNHLREKIFKRNEYNMDFLKDECINCYFEKKEIIKCGHSNNNFCNDIVYKCCKYNYCTDHIDHKKKCSNNICQNIIYICDNCLWDFNSHKNFHDLVVNKDTSFCRNCKSFFCKDCIRGRFCKLCCHLAYDYHSDYD